MEVLEIRDPQGLIIELFTLKKTAEILQQHSEIIGGVLFEVLVGRVIAKGNAVDDVNIGDIVFVSPFGAVRWKINNVVYMYFTYNELLGKIEGGENDGNSG